MAENGTDIVLYVNTTGSTYVEIGSQTGITITETTEVIDVSNKGSRKRAILPGKYASTIELDSLYVESDSNLALFEAAMRDGTTIIVRRAYSGSATHQATVVVSNYSVVAPYEDGATLSMTLEVDGAWTEV